MIKILVDENLPSSLLSDLGQGGIHAKTVGARPTDAEIWEHARKNGFVILTKDADFFDRLSIE